MIIRIAVEKPHLWAVGNTIGIRRELPGDVMGVVAIGSITEINGSELAIDCSEYAQSLSSAQAGDELNDLTGFALACAEKEKGEAE